MKTKLRVGILLATSAVIASVVACSNKPNKPDINPELSDKLPPVSEDANSTLPTTPATLEELAWRAEGYSKGSELDVILLDGNPTADAAISSLGAAKATPLTRAASTALLSRMKPLVADATDQQPFAKRERSLPPPRKGATVEAPFPPATDQGAPTAAANEAKVKQLEVTRFAPDGEVPMAPQVSITFNDPMVAVGSHADSIKGGVPVELTPKVPGKWRWVGTKTLLFEPEALRLPMATEFKLVVKDGVESINGNKLAEPFSASFKTPPPTITTIWPQYGTYPLDQPIFMEFDQEIDPEAMLEFVSIKGGLIFGSRTPVIASAADYEDEEQIKELIARAKKKRWMVIKSKDTLPYDSNIQTTIKVGAPSAEGPLTTASKQSNSFKTFGPLRVQESRCGWGGACRPADAFYFLMSNDLDVEKFDPAQVKVEPTFPGMNIYASGSYIYIEGEKPGRRSYKITLDKEIEDQFGQKLGVTHSKTFKVGAADPRISSNGGKFVVLDPHGEPTYTVFSMNYKELVVRAYSVEPSSWDTYLEWFDDHNYWAHHKKSPPGKLIEERTIKVDGEPDDMVQTDIALSKALGGDGLGHVILEIVPRSTMKGSSMPEYPPKIRTWVQATQIGLDAFVDRGELIGWATSLESGEPLEGVELSVRIGSAAGKSDETGVANLELSSASGRSNYLQAKKGKDVSILPEEVWRSNTSWHKQNDYNQLGWFVFDDRKMYKPGERVNVKGWARLIEDREGGDVRLPNGARELTYKVFGPLGNELGKGKTEVDALGGFDFDFELPETPNLGNAYVNMNISGVAASNTNHNHSFQIQEFRRPEFEVSTSAPEGPFLAGERANVSVSAKYYAGGALANAETSWQVRTSASSFTPPNQQKYTFGSWTPWWVTWRSGAYTPEKYKNFQGKTDAAGDHHLELELGAISPPRPMSVHAQATVMDVNRQAWTSSKTLLIHPSEHYVGMRSDKYFVEKGDPLDIQVVVSDIDGELVEGRPVKVKAARTQWSYQNGSYIEEEVDPQHCEFTSTKSEHQCTFETSIGGTYQITAITLDDQRRENFTRITRWVSGGQTPPARRVEQERVQLIPDREVFQPGDTAKLLVQSPFTPAEGLLTYRRNGITHQRRFTMSEPTTTIEVPLKSAHVPNLHIQVDLVGSTPRLDSKGNANHKLPRRPAYAKGSINLKIPPLERALEVNLKPANARVDPGTETSIEVEVKDASGGVVEGAQVALIVVDESVLALSSYAMADPLSLFYATRPAGARDYHSRGYTILVDPDTLNHAATPKPAFEPSRAKKRKTVSRRQRASDKLAAPAASAPAAPMEESAIALDTPTDDAFFANNEFDASEQQMGGDASGGQQGPAIALRTNFDALANFSPAVTTDAHGKATVQIQMPDNLTRYRIMAVAVEGGKKFGKSESAVTARLPLMVRPSPPRFLNFGDKFELPVVLQNQTDEPMTVQVATRATNIELASAAGFELQIPANDRVEVRFPATTAMSGTARFQVAASAGSHADASEFELPVWTPATSEAFATYGVIDHGIITQPVKPPEEVWPQFGQLEVTTSSTALQALTDAFLYLYHYDYECAEQISSRMISVAALRDVLTAFEAERMPTPAQVEASMKRDIDELLARQNHDGGFGLWRRGQPSWPYVSLHASHALARAQQKGYKVNAHALTRVKSYLTHIERYTPGHYSEWARRTIIAYALYVRGLLGDKDPVAARALLDRAGSLDEMSFETLGWLLGVMAGDKASAKQLADIRKYLGNRVTETAGAAYYARSYSQNEGYVIMHSDRRADGIILEALIDDSPKSALIPKIVAGLMAHRKQGRWGNTQENAFVLLALDKYFNTYEKQTPDFIARAWLGGRFAGEHKFKGRTTERHQINVPMKYVLEQDGDQNLILQNDGKGRMYYRIGMSYAPKSLFIDSAEHGFVVERVYEPVDNDEDVRREADGTWVIKAGAKVRIRLTMVATTRRYHVALVDPLPGGLETLNPALATTEDLPQDPSMNTGKDWWWWSRPWFEHQNMRDERTEAFTTLLWGGVHHYTYYARATTPGEFIAPPAKAEEMYSPETFGRSASDRVRVE